MKQDNVEVFLGHPLSDPTEQKFLRQLRQDLEQRGVSALILANLEVSRQHRQLDFVIVTSARTVQCELKGFRLPVIGSANGRWEQIMPGGERRPLDSNPGRQAKEGTFALSDELKAFARKVSVPVPDRKQFYRGIDTVVCVFPEIPEGSEIDRHPHVTVMGYSDLLARLVKEGPRLRWKDEHWRAFIRHLRLYRLEDRPELARQEREHKQLADDYSRRFSTSHRSELSTQVPTAARIDDEDVTQIELGARLQRGEAVTVFGPSGVGKTLMSRHAAVELAEAGHVPIWLDAADYDGHFDTLLGRAVAPFTTRSARELIRAASATGRTVAVIVDGLNEAPPASRTDLLGEVGALRLKEQAAVAISCLAAPALPETLEGHLVELLLPDRAEKELVLEAYAAGALAAHSDAFSTPFELVIAAECAGDLSGAPTRALVLDAYVRRLAPSEGVRSVLRALARQMHAELRGSLRVQETVRQLQRAAGVSAEMIDRALASKLLRVHQGRLSFSHESFVRFLAAEAIVIDAADVEALSTALAQPSNEELRSDALALESEERLGSILATLTDEGVLIAAIVGDLGERCRSAVEQVIADLFERARSVTDEAVPGERDWELAREWSRSEAALLSAVGRAMHRGRLLPGTIELFEQTDSRCSQLLEKRGALDDAQAVSEMVAASYALPLMSSSRWLPATVILRGAEHDFTGRRRESPSSGIPAQLLARAGAHSWGLLLLAAAVTRRFDPEDQEIMPELLSKGWAAGAYHVHLAVLNLSQDAAWSIKGPARERMKQTIERIDTNNIFAGSFLLEVLDAYGMMDGRPLEDVEREIAAFLELHEDDELAGRTARGIISSQFEPEGIVGPYREAILSLDDAVRAKLYRRAIIGAAADDLSTDVAVMELAKVGDLSDPLVQEAFAALLRSPGSEKWHSAQGGMRSCLAATDACARFATEPVLPPEDLSGFEGWRIVFSLLFWQERERVEEADYSLRLWDLLGALREPAVRAGVPAVLYVTHISGGMMETDGPSAHHRLLKRFPEEIRELFHWSLTHEQELTSCFLHYGSARISPYVVDMLGMIGDESSVELLRSHANSSQLARSAREAVRSIEARLAALG
jgi:RecA/RadA recombinase